MYNWMVSHKIYKEDYQFSEILTALIFIHTVLDNNAILPKIDAAKLPRMVEIASLVETTMKTRVTEQ